GNDRLDQTHEDALNLSIIIPAFNEERLIGATLRQVQSALTVFHKRGWGTEIIVCDNNSTDSTAEVAGATGATVVFEPVNQIARARNRGAGAASGDWLIFIDADSQPSAELFVEVMEQIETGECLAGGVTVKLEGNYPKANFMTHGWNWISRAFNWMAGSFIFCEASAFRKVGGFSQELFASEELDLSKRLKRLARESGKKIVILHRYPLLTSARKIYLYTLGEHLRFLGRTVVTRGKTLTSREAWH